MTQYDRNTMETYLDEILSMTGIPRRHLIFFPSARATRPISRQGIVVKMRPKSHHQFIIGLKERFMLFRSKTKTNYEVE